MPEMTDEVVVIVGAGQAGGRCALALRSEGFSGRITLIGAESHPPYERPPLSKAVLKGAEGEAGLFLDPDGCWQGIDLRTGETVVALDCAGRRVITAAGERIAYDHLVLATGGRPRDLPVPGGEHARTLRSLDDSRGLKARLTPGLRLAIIGGGVIGMEVAATATELGCAVTVIEAGARVMARILPPETSTWLAAKHAAAGVTILTGIAVQEIREETGELAIHLRDSVGKSHVVAADLVVSAIGILPASELVPAANRGASGGILTDSAGRVAGLVGVFAAGDVAESWNPHLGRQQRLETWRNADRQPRAIARSITGETTEHAELPWMWSDQLGHNIQVVGLWAEGARTVARGEGGEVLFWLDDQEAVAGGVLLDRGRERRFLEKLVEGKVKADPAKLADSSVPLKSLV
ncbi:NAD(P)/FAD-dependent oxidoreductase [Pararhodobacter sp.]|uniref:NAD(P)/FAD-dependent oxidoreductase n=1 Tax=Pararhodobacter sp. TaxID=2127056 RepID=UPI002AFE3C4D|nr:FAD-dependent oxidoreductase [Pararhodobacter sp.]